MHENNTNTAADRLLKIMQKVAAANPGELLLKGWSIALDRPNASKLEIFRGIISVAELVGEVELAIQRHDGPATRLYQRSLDGTRHILMSNLEAPKHSITSLLTPQLLNDLEHCAAMYSTIDHEIQVKPETVNAIRESVGNLFNDIKDSDLPEELRCHLLDLLEVMRQHLSEFEIRGATALHDCLRQALARLMEIYPAAQKYSGSSLLKRLANVVSDIGKICEGAQKALPTIKLATKFLPFLAPHDLHHALPDAVDAELVTVAKDVED